MTEESTGRRKISQQGKYRFGKNHISDFFSAAHDFSTPFRFFQPWDRQQEQKNKEQQSGQCGVGENYTHVETNNQNTYSRQKKNG